MKMRGKLAMLAVSLAFSEVLSVGGVFAQSADSYTLKPLEQWELNLNGSYVQNFGQVTFGPDGTIYAETWGTPAKTVDEGYLYALQPNGKEKWSLHLDMNASGPAVGSDGAVYAFSDLGRVFEAVSPEGKLKWTYQADQFGFETFTPSIGPDGTVYIIRHGMDTDSLTALTPAGQLKWEVNPDEAEHGLMSRPIVGKDGTLFCGIVGNKKTIYAIQSDGTLKWSFTGEGETHPYGGLNQPVIGKDGTIYVGMNDGYVYAIGDDGTRKWAYQTGKYNHGIPVLDSQGNIYIMGLNLSGVGSVLYALSPEGKLNWPLEMNNIPNVQLTIHDDHLYLQDRNGKFMEFSTDGKMTEDQALPAGQSGTLTFDKNNGFYIGQANKLIYYANRFRDVPNTHWVFKNGTIQWAAQNHVSVGYPDGSFKPDQQVNEGEFAALFTRSYASENGFQLDPVSGEAWTEPYYNVVMRMNWDLPGIPSVWKRVQPITRGNVAVLIAEAVSGTKMTEQAAVSYLLDYGLATGRIQGESSIDSFQPDASLTRAEAVQFIRNLKYKGIATLKKVNK